MMDGVEWTILNSIGFTAWSSLNVPFYYHREAPCFFFRRTPGIFLQDFHAHFSYFFQVAAYWEVLKSNANSQVLWDGFHSINSLKASWSWCNQCLGLSMLYHQNETLETNNDSLTINTTNFLSCFCIVFVFHIYYQFDSVPRF